MKNKEKYPWILCSLLCLTAGLLYSGIVCAAEKDPFFPEGIRSSAAGTGTQDSTWGRDPFSRPFEGKGSSSKTSGRIRSLTGIIYGKDVRVAIFDGETHKEGSMVGGRKLMDIRKRSVVLRGENGSREEIFLEDFSMRK
ncbi:MAG: hypothetical protein WC539_05995 [Nitrospirota bacterium]